jgi:hypothetical protein
VEEGVRRVSDTLVWVTGITQAITAMVAVAALVVSIIALYLQRRDRLPKLEISGSLSTHLGADLMPHEHVYTIKVANHSAVPVTVAQLYIWDKPNWKMTVLGWRGDKPLPCKLEPWDGASWWANYEGLRERLREQGHRGKLKIKLGATDASGGSHFKRTTIVLNAPWWRRMFGT